MELPVLGADVGVGADGGAGAGAAGAADAGEKEPVKDMSSEGGPAFVSH